MLRFYKAKIAVTGGNVLERISRIEIIGQEDSLVDNRQRRVESQTYVRIVNTVSLCAQAAAFVINICANNIPNSSYRNNRLMSALDKYFSNPIVAETSFLVVGASAPLSLLLMMINSSGSFAKYLPPLLKWGVYLTLLPEILYVIMFNVPSIKSNECLLNIWLMLVVVSHSFPTLFFGSIICLLDLDRQIWSIGSYILHSLAVTTAVCFTLLELTSLTSADLGIYQIVIPWSCNLISLSLSTIGMVAWIKAGSKLKGESTLAKHYSYVISLILGSLNIYYWGMLIVVAVKVFNVSNSNYLRQSYQSFFIYANATTAVLFTVVILILSKLVIEQQADVLEQVFEEHAEVFIKPMPLESWQHRRQAWADDVDNEVSRLSFWAFEWVTRLGRW